MVVMFVAAMLIMTPGKYYSVGKPHDLGMWPHQVTLTSHNEVLLLICIKVKTNPV